MSVSRTSSDSSFTDKNWTLVDDAGFVVSKDSESVPEFDNEEVQFSECEDDEQVDNIGEEEVDAHSVVVSTTTCVATLCMLIDWALAVASRCAMKVHALESWAIAKVVPYLSKIAAPMLGLYGRYAQVKTARRAQLSKKTRVMLRVSLGTMISVAFSYFVLLDNAPSSSKPSHVSVIASFPRMNPTAQPGDVKHTPTPRRELSPLLAPLTYNPSWRRDTDSFGYPPTTAGALMRRRTMATNMAPAHFTGATQPTVDGGARRGAPPVTWPTADAEDVRVSSSSTARDSTAKMRAQSVSAFADAVTAESRRGRVLETLGMREESLWTLATANKAFAPPTRYRSPAPMTQHVKDANSLTADTAMAEKKTRRASSLEEIMRVKTAFAPPTTRKAPVPLTAPMLGGGVRFSAPAAERPTNDVEDVQRVIARPAATSTEKYARSLEEILRMRTVFAGPALNDAPMPLMEPLVRSEVRFGIPTAKRPISKADDVQPVNAQTAATRTDTFVRSLEEIPHMKTTFAAPLARKAPVPLMDPLVHSEVRFGTPTAKRSTNNADDVQPVGAQAAATRTDTYARSLEEILRMKTAFAAPLARKAPVSLTVPMLDGEVRFGTPTAKRPTNNAENLKPVGAQAAATKTEKYARSLEEILRMKTTFAAPTTRKAPVSLTVPMLGGEVRFGTPTSKRPANNAENLQPVGVQAAATRTEKRAKSLEEILRMKTTFAAPTTRKTPVPVTVPMLDGGVRFRATSAKESPTCAKDAPVTCSTRASGSAVKLPVQPVSFQTTSKKTKRTRSFEAIARMTKAFAAHIAATESSVPSMSTSLTETTKDKGKLDVGALNREIMLKMPPVKALFNEKSSSRATDMADAVAWLPKEPAKPSWPTEGVLAEYIQQALEPCIPRERFVRLMLRATSEIDLLRKQLADEKIKARRPTSLVLPKYPVDAMVAFKRAYHCERVNDTAAMNSKTPWWVTEELVRENAKLKKEIIMLTMQLEEMKKKMKKDAGDA